MQNLEPLYTIILMKENCHEGKLQLHKVVAGEKSHRQRSIIYEHTNSHLNLHVYYTRTIISLK